MNTSRVETASLPDAFVSNLKRIFRQEILTDPADCWPYGYDNSRRHALPQAVVFATSEGEILELVKSCNEFNVPLIPRGKGTGTTGATVPTKGGLVLSLERMNRILEIDVANRMARVEPGVINQDLQDALAEHGFFWPPDPTSKATCTIGGNLAYNSAGPRAVKYGTPRENTLALKAVTASGELLTTGSHTTKGVVGYDLTRLLIGSEGTLAIITEATLKLTPLAEQTYTLQAAFADTHTAATAVSSLMAQSVIPRSLEFIDGAALRMIHKQKPLDLPQDTDALLMIEVDGDRDQIESAADKLANLTREAGALSVETARTRQEADKLWQVRKSLSPALRSIAPKKINEDVVVPVSRIPELIDGLANLSEETGIAIVNFGHAGNGNIHVNLLLDPDDPAQKLAAAKCLDQVFKLVLELEGTLSGEHGVGLEKRDYIDLELSAVSLGIMHKIKEAFDPRNILNPDKTLPLAEQMPDQHRV